MIDKKLLMRRLALSAYFVAAFLVFLLLLFPFDRVKFRIESAVRAQTPYEFTIGSISPRFFNHFVFTDIVLSNKSGAVLFESPSVSTTISLWGLLRNMLDLELNARAYGGDVSVKLRQGPGRQRLLLDANGLDIGAYSLVSDSGLKLSGKLGGTIDVSGDSGKGRLWLKGLTWRSLTIKGFPIPDLDFDQCWLEADIKGDRMTIKKLELDGKELKIQCQGEIVLRERGPLNLTVKLKPSERMAREQEGLLSLIKNKDAEGFYQFMLGGTLSEPLPRL